MKFTLKDLKKTINNGDDIEIPEIYQERLIFEANILRKYEPSFHPVNGDIRRWEGEIEGLNDYKGLKIRIEIVFPLIFPQKPPKVKILSKIWHPNISLHGEPCLNILNNWHPKYTAVDIINAIRGILAFPDASTAMNQKAALEFQTNYNLFKKHIREFYSL